MDLDRLQYLLERYLNQTATPEEVEEYRRLAEQFSASESRMLDGRSSAEIKALQRKIRAGLMQAVEQQEEKTYRLLRIRRQLRWMAAASVVALTVTAFYFFLYPSTEQKTPPHTAAYSQPAPATSSLVRHSNTSDQEEKIQLGDGSSVVLFPNSGIVYQRSFASDKREVTLEGKAEFRVQPDAARPFTVFSNGISTTALGTSFTVDAYFPNEVGVVLHTGRIVVKQTTPGRVEEVYLRPGERLTCDVRTGVFTREQAAVAKKKPGDLKKLSFASRKGFEIEFEEQPLTEVFRAIEKAYTVELDFNEQEIANRLFSGRIRKTDSLLQVLHRISLLNELSIKETSNGFIIQ